MLYIKICQLTPSWCFRRASLYRHRDLHEYWWTSRVDICHI